MHVCIFVELCASVGTCAVCRFVYVRFVCVGECLSARFECVCVCVCV